AAPAQCSIVCPEARYAPNRLLPAFPTRRSSDLPPLRPHPRGREAAREDQEGPRRRPAAPRGAARRGDRARRRRGGRLNPAPVTRSEEHTSELQSRENLVCRLLLEKKERPKARGM